MSSAAASAQTLKLQALEARYHEVRIEKRSGLQTLARVVDDVRDVLDEQKADLRRRMEHERRQGFTRSVLVLDDDEMQRTLLRATLHGVLKVPVYVTATPAEAHAVWARHKCSTAVVDLLLGVGATGDQFIRELDHGVRAVLVSGIADRLTLTTAANTCNATPLSKEDLKALPSLVGELLDAVHPPLWCRADTDTLREVSDGLAALLGVPAEHLRGASWRALVHPDDLARSESERQRRIGVGVEGFEQRMRVASGAYVTLRWDVTPSTDGVLFAVARRV